MNKKQRLLSEKLQFLNAPSDIIALQYADIVQLVATTYFIAVK